VAAKLEEMKATDLSPKSAYPAAQFKADLAAGTVDTDKLGEALSFHEDTKKLALRMVGQLKKSQMDAAAKAGSMEIDWAAWEEKIGDAEMLADMKVTYEANMKAFDDAADKKIAEQVKAFTSKMEASFGGPDGIFKAAGAIETEARANIASAIAELEVLEKQIEGVSTQTIAEILEMEPEMRKEIEEEMANHQWM
jgi:hypothetical protein